MQARFDDARIFTVADAYQAFDEHGFELDLSFDVHLDLVGNRQKQQVGRTHAINGGDKSHGYAAAELGWIGQVFHHMNQAHDCAENADGWSVATGGIPDFCRTPLLFFVDVQFQFQCHPQRFRITAVNQHLYAFFHESIAQGANLGFQRQQAAFTRGLAPFQQGFDQFLWFVGGRQKHPLGQAQAVHEHRGGVLQHYRANRAAHDNQEGRQLQQRGNMPAFQRLSAKNGNQGQKNADNADFVEILHAGRAPESEGQTTLSAATVLL